MIDEEMDFTDPKMLRRKAEKQLDEKEKKAKGALKETDVNKLLHELQVHQIELEMQNDELQQVYETAETALKKYTLLFDLSPLGYFSLEEDGSITDLNFAAADMLGERRFSLINTNFKLFVSEDSKPVFCAFFEKVYTSNVKEFCEVMLEHNHEPLRRVYMEGVVIEDERKCLLSVVDFSKFVQS